MQLTPLPCALVLGSILVPSIFAATCYSLDQEEREGYIPCDTTADGVNSHSACCGINDVCMASGLCMSTRNSDPAGLLWVDACTDRSFKNRACPSICIDPNNMPMNVTYLNIVPCGTNEWCCNIGSYATVDLSQGVGTVIRQLPSVTGAVSSESTSSETMFSTISSTSSSTTVSNTSSSSSTDAVISPRPAEPNNNSNTGYIAGIAITSAGFAISLAAFLVTFHRFRRLKHKSQIQQPNFADYGAGQNKQYHEVETRETPVELPL
ncbi:hypothetical protein F4820DRAFT_383756 [Hypoxylon rubiginosum]|uniref:Uncharacterized protein n=1 Tax=Hypoxylon rubiginosum TaxID=110542 RepID=A0ACB9ZDD9_9PEZI|nr:hypothetical protein F4820DRAFT_383756 [Hypoxylon rubiginosum]